MITNVDARENAQAHYDHAIVKYKKHDIMDDMDGNTSPPGFSIMAQFHKKTKASRWLQDYLGMVD